MVLIRALPPAGGGGGWLTRMRHRVTDLSSCLAFSLPYDADTSITVMSCSAADGNNNNNNSNRIRLPIKQLSGGKVGSGGYLWDGGRRLASYLEKYGDGHHHHDSCRSRSSSSSIPSRSLYGRSLLELGSGTGSAGIVAAMLGCDVTITDQKSFVFPGSGPNSQLTPDNKNWTLLDLCTANVQQNTIAIQLAQQQQQRQQQQQMHKHKHEKQPQTQQHNNNNSNTSTSTSESQSSSAIVPVVNELLWGGDDQEKALKHDKYEIICGSDILLFTTAHDALLRTIRNLSTPTTVVIIEHTDRGNNSADKTRYPTDLEDFLKAVIKDGLWQPTIVRDHGRHITLRMVYAKKN